MECAGIAVSFMILLMTIQDNINTAHNAERRWSGMPDREKVVKGLEICSDCGFCESINKFELRCQYRNNDGKGCDRSQLLMDALAMLKEQDERIKTLESLRRIEHEGW